MAAKLKTDESGNPIVSDGLPVLVYEDGREAPLDFNDLIGKVKSGANKSQAMQEKLDEMEKRLAKFGAKDEEISKALEQFRGKGKKSEDESELEKRLAELQKGFAEERDAMKSRLESAILEAAFADPEVEKVLKEGKYALPRSVVRQMYQGRIGVDEAGRVVTYKDESKKDRVYSRKRHGEPATLAEAIDEFLATHPERGTFTLGTGATGGGAPGGASAHNSNEPKLKPVDRLARAFESSKAVA